MITSFTKILAGLLIFATYAELSANDSDVHFVFDGPVGRDKVAEIFNQVKILDHKRVHVSMGIIQENMVNPILTESQFTYPSQLNQNNGCNFSPCEKLNDYLDEWSPEVVFIIDPNFDFQCSIDKEAYILDNLETLQNYLLKRLLKKKDRKRNPRILVYVDSDFEQRRPKITLEAQVIQEGESTTLKPNKLNGSFEGEFVWLDVNGKPYFRAPQLVVNPIESTTYRLYYSAANNCQSDTIEVSVEVIPKPVCSPMTAMTIPPIAEGESEWFHYNDLYEEINFFPDDNNEFYVIPLDSICAPDFITFTLIDSDGNEVVLQSERLSFKDKIEDSRRLLTKKHYDNEQWYEILFQQDIFVTLDQKGPKFQSRAMTNKRYSMIIVAEYQDKDKKFQQIKSEPFYVYFYPCSY